MTRIPAVSTPTGLRAWLATLPGWHVADRPGGPLAWSAGTDEGLTVACTHAGLLRLSCIERPAMHVDGLTVDQVIALLPAVSRAIHDIRDALRCPTVQADCPPGDDYQSDPLPRRVQP